MCNLHCPQRVREQAALTLLLSEQEQELFFISKRAEARTVFIIGWGETIEQLALLLFCFLYFFSHFSSFQSEFVFRASVVKYHSVWLAVTENWSRVHKLYSEFEVGSTAGTRRPGVWIKLPLSERIHDIFANVTIMIVRISVVRIICRWSQYLLIVNLF